MLQNACGPGDNACGPGDNAVPESSQLHVRFPPLLGFADFTLALHLCLGVA